MTCDMHDSQKGVNNIHHGDKTFWLHPTHCTSDEQDEQDLLVQKSLELSQHAQTTCTPYLILMGMQISRQLLDLLLCDCQFLLVFCQGRFSS